MGRKTIGLILIMTVVIIGGTAFADENTRHFDRRGSLALKIGANMNSDSDFTDSWDFSPGVKFYPLEFAYEHRFGKLLSIELPIGVKKMEDSANYASGSSSEIDVTDFYFAPTLKFNFRTGNASLLYLGIGGDVISNRGTLTYHRAASRTNSAARYSLDVSETTWGAHGIVGFEYFIVQDPLEKGLYDLPVSIGLEYKYTWAEIDEYDADLIKLLEKDPVIGNDPFNTTKFDTGGHTLTFLLRWHFF